MDYAGDCSKLTDMVRGTPVIKGSIDDLYKVLEELITMPELTSSTAALEQIKDGREPVRFDSFRFRIFLKLIGSVRFGSDKLFSRFDPIRLPVERLMARSCSVRTVSASGSGRFQSQAVRFGSVRFGRFGSLFLPARTATRGRWPAAIAISL